MIVANDPIRLLPVPGEMLTVWGEMVSAGSAIP